MIPQRPAALARSEDAEGQFARPDHPPQAPQTTQAASVGTILRLALTGGAPAHQQTGGTTGPSPPVHLRCCLSGQQHCSIVPCVNSTASSTYQSSHCEPGIPARNGTAASDARWSSVTAHSLNFDPMQSQTPAVHLHPHSCTPVNQLVKGWTVSGLSQLPSQVAQPQPGPTVSNSNVQPIARGWPAVGHKSDRVHTSVKPGYRIRAAGEHNASHAVSVPDPGSICSTGSVAHVLSTICGIVPGRHCAQSPISGPVARGEHG